MPSAGFAAGAAAARFFAGLCFFFAGIFGSSVSIGVISLSQDDLVQIVVFAPRLGVAGGKAGAPCFVGHEFGLARHGAFTRGGRAAGATATGRRDEYVLAPRS